MAVYHLGAALQHLLDALSLGRQLAEAGLKLVESQYGWQAFGQHFTQICEATGDAYWLRQAFDCAHAKAND